MWSKTTITFTFAPTYIINIIKRANIEGWHISTTTLSKQLINVWIYLWAKKATTFFLGKCYGQRSLGVLPTMRSQRVVHDWVTKCTHTHAHTQSKSWAHTHTHTQSKSCCCILCGFLDQRFSKDTVNLIDTINKTDLNEIYGKSIASK